MVLLIDNYDSFTFNIYDYLYQAGAKVIVIKNNEKELTEITKLRFTKIVISPGPGNPNTAGISLQIMSELANKYPILGICLGHQVIAQHYGYKIINADVPMHGKTDYIYHDNQGVYKGLANPFLAVRYHSLVVENNFSNDNLIITATNKQKIIMGLRHKTLPIESIQFHPEAIKTEYGLDIITNFVKNNF